MRVSGLPLERFGELAGLMYRGELDALDISGLELEIWLGSKFLVQGDPNEETICLNWAYNNKSQDVELVFDVLAGGAHVVLDMRESVIEEIELIDRIYGFLISNCELAAEGVHPVGVLTIIAPPALEAVLTAQSKVAKEIPAFAEKTLAAFADYEYIYKSLIAADKIASFFRFSAAYYLVGFEDSSDLEIAIQPMSNYDLGMGGVRGLWRIENAARRFSGTAKSLKLSKAEKEALELTRTVSADLFGCLLEATSHFEEMGMVSLLQSLNQLHEQDDL